MNNCSSSEFSMVLRRAIKGVASSRHGRSKGAWLRHLLHSDPALERRAR